MTQKDNVKQLIGKSLNAYNNKVLQQIDRIEKKNEQQNHKISMLTNELDNDYLTKSEEGSVISLDHSKEGMVYIDGLEGNTLVNYCTDGSKELTLNGDIDLEGTFVTTTEGVDNGLVDVSCEGNTLVNIANDKTVSGTRRNGNIIITPTKLYSQFSVTHSELMSKLNTTYTIRIEVLSNTSTVPLAANKYNGTFNGWNGIEVGFTGEKIFTYTTGSEYQFSRWFWVENNVVGEGEIEIRLTILEGDWTDKEIPPYFEGMKSVGQDNENGHKIEILSRNKNMIQGLPRTVAQDIVSHDIYLEPNKTYSISTNVPFHGGLGMIGKNHNHKNPIITFQNWGENVKRFSTPNNFTKGIYSLIFWKSGLATDETSWTQVEIGTTTTEYTLGTINKKEILLNEPLRKVNDDLKDRFVKIGNKCFIERNCKVQTLNGSEGWRISDGGTQFICNQHRTDALGATNIPIICDKINVTTHQILDNGEGYGINLSYYLRINLRDCDAKNGATVEQFIQRLQANPVTIIYPLKTPTYEPLEIEPTLNTYTDTTHISNNSIIPCNMKIQNTGYNAIIKPSTLYTVALDTNKSGTIGTNLGGVKGTTTNNVLTLTTPATLTDDSLRLYGKGIKGSKVRILEGDKTNWIPSHFEGMKSSFEDKFDVTDNTYKMKILSNNINLVDYENIGHKGIPTNEFTIKGDKITLNSSKTYQALYYHIPVKRGEDYIVSCKNITNGNVLIYDTKVQGHYADKYKLSIGKNTVKARITPKSDYITLRVSVETMVNTDCTFEQLMIHRANVSSEFKFNKSNKIQFSSIEPLRSVEDVKDRFVLKDDKLMIERNIGQYLVNGNENWTINGSDVYFNFKSLVNNFARNQKTCITSKYPNFKHSSSSNKGYVWWGGGVQDANGNLVVKPQIGINNIEEYKIWVKSNNYYVLYLKSEPTYEEIPFELQKIFLEGYENGTLFFDTNIPPTSTITYAGETPIVKSVRLNKTEVSNNTNDINDNIIPYLMDMDYRVVCLQLESNVEGISMAKLFGGVYEMLKRDILSKRLTKEEYGYRLTDYFNAGKLTEEQVRELEDLR